MFCLPNIVSVLARMCVCVYVCVDAFSQKTMKLKMTFQSVGCTTLGGDLVLNIRNDSINVTGVNVVRTPCLLSNFTSVSVVYE